MSIHAYIVYAHISLPHKVSESSPVHYEEAKYSTFFFTNTKLDYEVFNNAMNILHY